MKTTHSILVETKNALPALTASRERKNLALQAIADRLLAEQDAILEAKEICGMDKLMWGSDYPRTMTDITYRSAVRFLVESEKLSDEDKRAFLGENAVRFYGFEGLQPLPEIGNML